jgi:hypothetical protein
MPVMALVTAPFNVVAGLAAIGSVRCMAAAPGIPLKVDTTEAFALTPTRAKAAAAAAFEGILATSAGATLVANLVVTVLAAATPPNLAAAPAASLAAIIGNTITHAPLVCF